MQHYNSSSWNDWESSNPYFDKNRLSQGQSLEEGGGGGDLGVNARESLPLLDKKTTARLQCIVFFGLLASLVAGGMVLFNSSSAGRRNTIDPVCRNHRCAHRCIPNRGDGDDDENGYICACDKGYKKDQDDAFECIDDNECAKDNGGCAHKCKNTDGGFNCECAAGFTLEGGNGSECLDIDECNQDDHQCGDHSTCSNTVGSFECACNKGYIPDDDGGCVDVNECKDRTYGCDPGSEYCINTVGGYECVDCPIGFSTDTNGLECTTDIDECTTEDDDLKHKCGDHSKCQNRIGALEGGLGYECVCDTGYEPLLAPVSDGEPEPTTCTDIDECSKGDHGCDAACSNTDGSFVCGCSAGYILAANGYTCGDINECTTDDDDLKHKCGDHSLCHNLIGALAGGLGYKCVCDTGYEPIAPVSDGEPTTCTDIDECDGGGHDGCHTCTNTDGGFQCGCEEGNGYYTTDDFKGGCLVNMCYSGEVGSVFTLTGWSGSSTSTDVLVGRFDDEFGRSVTAVGDLDGNGVHDMVVGSPKYDAGGSDRGAVYIIFLEWENDVDGRRRTTKVKSVMPIKSESPESGFVGPLDDQDWFGFSVAGVGDLNKDGVPDLAVGAPNDDDGGHHKQGAVYILFLDKDVKGRVHREKKISATKGGFGSDRFGWSVAALGDLDENGVPDLAVGAPYDDDGGLNQGAVYILFMKDDGSVKSEKKITSSSQQGELLVGGGQQGHPYLFGYSVAVVGDINSDGVSDLAVGAPKDGEGDTVDAGAVYILFMNTDGSMGVEQKITSNVQGGLVATLSSYDRFGTSVAGVGDLDGDGVMDLAVGAPYRYSDHRADRRGGAVYLLLLKRDGSVRGEQKISSGQAGMGEVSTIEYSLNFGSSVARVGDLDDDGGDDGVKRVELAVGAPLYHVDGDWRSSVSVIEVPRGFVPVCDEASQDCTNIVVNDGAITPSYECKQKEEVQT